MKPFLFVLTLSLFCFNAFSQDALSLSGNNPTSSINGFVNKIEFTGTPHGALVFKPGSSKELMFGMHDNGNFYWGTGRSATQPNFYGMTLNGNTGELSPKSINLTGGTITDRWRTTNFHWAGHSLVFGSKPGRYAHNVIEIKPGGASQGQLLAGFRMHHAISEIEHDLRVNIDTRTNVPTYFDVGNFGIGTRTPERKLDVISSNNNIARFKVDDAPNDNFQIHNSTTVGGQFIPLLVGHHQSDNRYSISIMGSTIESMDNGSNPLVNFDARRTNGPIQNRPLFNWTNYNNSRMIMDANGNLGIGTTNPQNKLSVNGTIWAKEVKISLTDAADWVFEKDYNLRPLAEVESYIKANKHLPEIPSAAELRKNDLKVSEMTNKLLQKIEELTLYAIEQEKKLEKIKTLESELFQQKGINKILEKRLTALENKTLK